MGSAPGGVDSRKQQLIVAVPNKKDRSRPVELLILSAVLSIFVGLIVLMSTRDLQLAVIFLGIAFIVVLVVLAMLSLAVRPSGDEQDDLDEQNRGH